MRNSTYKPSFTVKKWEGWATASFMQHIEWAQDQYDDESIPLEAQQLFNRYNLDCIKAIKELTAEYMQDLER